MNTTYTVKHIQKGPTLFIDPFYRRVRPFLSMTVDNLFDRRYCDYGEYFDPWYVYPAAGRSFMFTVRYEF